MAITLGCGQITWNHSGASQDQVLQEIKDAGYVGAPWSSRYGPTAAEVEAAFERHGLRPAPGYLWLDLWERDKRQEHLAETRRQAEISRQLGLSEIYVSAGGFHRERPGHRTRWQAAGHVTPDDALGDEEFKALAQGLEEVGRATLEYGVRACYHNHVGTFVETRQEVEKLLSLVDPAAVFLGPDTGHLAWTGEDVVDFCKTHLDRIKTLHIKDINAEARERGKQEDWDYGEFSDNGIFVEIGEGLVDYPALFRLLGEHNFEGWVIVETDVTRKPTPLASATISRRNLAKLGV